MDKHTKIIVLPHGERTQLAKDFKVSYPTVYSALCFKTNSGIAKILRAAALNRGGYEFSKRDKQ